MALIVPEHVRKWYSDLGKIGGPRGSKADKIRAAKASHKARRENRIKSSKTTQVVITQ